MVNTVRGVDWDRQFSKLADQIRDPDKLNKGLRTLLENYMSFKEDPEYQSLILVDEYPQIREALLEVMENPRLRDGTNANMPQQLDMDLEFPIKMLLESQDDDTHERIANAITSVVVGNMFKLSPAQLQDIGKEIKARLQKVEKDFVAYEMYSSLQGIRDMVTSLHETESETKPISSDIAEPDYIDWYRVFHWLEQVVSQSTKKDDESLSSGTNSVLTNVRESFRNMTYINRSVNKFNNQLRNLSLEGVSTALGWLNGAYERFKETTNDTSFVDTYPIVGKTLLELLVTARTFFYADSRRGQDTRTYFPWRILLDTQDQDVVSKIVILLVATAQTGIAAIALDEANIISELLYTEIQYVNKERDDQECTIYEIYQVLIENLELQKRMNIASGTPDTRQSSEDVYRVIHWFKELNRLAKWEPDENILQSVITNARAVLKRVGNGLTH